MSLRKRDKYSLPPVISTYNQTADNNPSHLVDEYTNFVLRPITLEDLDKAVFDTFNRRFTIAGKQINLIPLDAEVASMRFENPEQFDKVKQYLNFPYFTMWRNDTGEQMFRTSPSFKPVYYCIPKSKPQGIVYEEWIAPAPIYYKFPYTFMFLTTYREYTNTMEQYMMEYFKNKRNVISLDYERFEIQPATPKKIASLDVVDREGKTGQSLYKLTYTLELMAYTRKQEDIQKRERTNRYVIRVVGETGKTEETISTTETRPLESIE